MDLSCKSLGHPSLEEMLCQYPFFLSHMLRGNGGVGHTHQVVVCKTRECGGLTKGNLPCYHCYWVAASGVSVNQRAILVAYKHRSMVTAVTNTNNTPLGLAGRYMANPRVILLFGESGLE